MPPRRDSSNSSGLLSIIYYLLSIICYLLSVIYYLLSAPPPRPGAGRGIGYAFAQESLSVTVRLSTGLPGTESRLSAQK